MDPELLESALAVHGTSLMQQLIEEQGEALSVPSALRRRYGIPDAPVKDKLEAEDKSDPEFVHAVQKFIARKADMLFSTQHHTVDRLKASETDMAEDVYGIMPPLESFMGLPPEVCEDHFYESLMVGDVVVGVVSSVSDSGLIATLLCTDTPGVYRDIDELNISAFCPAKELPRMFAHQSLTEAYHPRDAFRGVVLAVNPDKKKIFVTLKSRSSVDDEEEHPKLGLISKDDFPVHYRRKIERCGLTFSEMLHSILGFTNKHSVDALQHNLCLSSSHSLMRGLYNVRIPENEYADNLRKWQTSKQAHDSVVVGVEMVKQGKQLEAIQHLNMALKIDPSHTEALVARGALYANNACYLKAIEDFEAALEANPKHVNARKYLVETKFVYARRFEEQGQTEEALQNYKEILKVDADFLGARQGAERCQHLLGSGKGRQSSRGSRSSSRGRSGSSSSSSDSSSTDSKESLQKSADKLKRLMQAEKVSRKLGRKSGVDSQTSSTKKKSNSAKERRRSRKESSSSSASSLLGRTAQSSHAELNQLWEEELRALHSKQEKLALPSTENCVLEHQQGRSKSMSLQAISPSPSTERRSPQAKSQCQSVDRLSKSPGRSLSSIKRFASPARERQLSRGRQNSKSSRGGSYMKSSHSHSRSPVRSRTRTSSYSRSRSISPPRKKARRGRNGSSRSRSWSGSSKSRAVSELNRRKSRYIDLLLQLSKGLGAAGKDLTAAGGDGGAGGNGGGVSASNKWDDLSTYIGASSKLLSNLSLGKKRQRSSNHSSSRSGSRSSSRSSRRSRRSRSRRSCSGQSHSRGRHRQRNRSRTPSPGWRERLESKFGARFRAWRDQQMRQGKFQDCERPGPFNETSQQWRPEWPEQRRTGGWQHDRQNFRHNRSEVSPRVEPRAWHGERDRQDYRGPDGDSEWAEMTRRDRQNYNYSEGDSEWTEKTRRDGQDYRDPEGDSKWPEMTRRGQQSDWAERDQGEDHRWGGRWRGGRGRDYPDQEWEEPRQEGGPRIWHKGQSRQASNRDAARDTKYVDWPGDTVSYQLREHDKGRDEGYNLEDACEKSEVQSSKNVQGNEKSDKKISDQTRTPEQSVTATKREKKEKEKSDASATIKTMVASDTLAKKVFLKASGKQMELEDKSAMSVENEKTNVGEKTDKKGSDHLLVNNATLEKVPGKDKAIDKKSAKVDAEEKGGKLKKGKDNNSYTKSDKTKQQPKEEKSYVEKKLDPVASEEKSRKSTEKSKKKDANYEKSERRDIEKSKRTDAHCEKSERRESEKSNRTDADYEKSERRDSKKSKRTDVDYEKSDRKDSEKSKRDVDYKKSDRRDSEKSKRTDPDYEKSERRESEKSNRTGADYEKSERRESEKSNRTDADYERSERRESEKSKKTDVDYKKSDRRDSEKSMRTDANYENFERKDRSERKDIDNDKSERKDKDYEKSERKVTSERKDAAYEKSESKVTDSGKSERKDADLEKSERKVIDVNSGKGQNRKAEMTEEDRAVAGAGTGAGKREERERNTEAKGDDEVKQNEAKKSTGGDDQNQENSVVVNRKGTLIVVSKWDSPQRRVSRWDGTEPNNTSSLSTAAARLPSAKTLQAQPFSQAAKADKLLPRAVLLTPNPKKSGTALDQENKSFKAKPYILSGTSAAALKTEPSEELAEAVMSWQTKEALAQSSVICYSQGGQGKKELKMAPSKWVEVQQTNIEEDKHSSSSRKPFRLFPADAKVKKEESEGSGFAEKEKSKREIRESADLSSVHKQLSRWEEADKPDRAEDVETKGEKCQPENEPQIEEWWQEEEIFSSWDTEQMKVEKSKAQLMEEAMASKWDRDDPDTAKGGKKNNASVEKKQSQGGKRDDGQNQSEVSQSRQAEYNEMEPERSYSQKIEDSETNKQQQNRFQSSEAVREGDSQRHRERCDSRERESREIPPGRTGGSQENYHKRTDDRERRRTSFSQERDYNSSDCRGRKGRSSYRQDRDHKRSDERRRKSSSLSQDREQENTNSSHKRHIKDGEIPDDRERRHRHNSSSSQEKSDDSRERTNSEGTPSNALHNVSMKELEEHFFRQIAAQLAATGSFSGCDEWLRELDSSSKDPHSGRSRHRRDKAQPEEEKVSSSGSESEGGDEGKDAIQRQQRQDRAAKPSRSKDKMDGKGQKQEWGSYGHTSKRRSEEEEDELYRLESTEQPDPVERSFSQKKWPSFAKEVPKSSSRRERSPETNVGSSWMDKIISNVENKSSTKMPGDADIRFLFRQISDESLSTKPKTAEEKKTPRSSKKYREEDGKRALDESLSLKHKTFKENKTSARSYKRHREEDYEKASESKRRRKRSSSFSSSSLSSSSTYSSSSSRQKSSRKKTKSKKSEKKISLKRKKKRQRSSSSSSSTSSASSGHGRDKQTKSSDKSRKTRKSKSSSKRSSYSSSDSSSSRARQKKKHGKEKAATKNESTARSRSDTKLQAVAADTVTVAMPVQPPTPTDKKLDELENFLKELKSKKKEQLIAEGKVKKM